MINNKEDLTDKVLIHLSKDDVEITLKKYHNNSTFLYAIYSTSIVKLNNDLSIKDESFYQDYLDAVDSFESLQIQSFNKIYLKILGAY